MQALIDFIIRNLLALWPLVTVDEWKAAMMVRNGRIHRPLSAGLHWRWLFVERKIDYPKSEVVVTLATSSITTADGKAVAVDANLGFRLIEIAKSWRNVWNLESSVKAATAGVICSELSLRSWPELQGEHRKTREAEILKALAGVADSFGVEIVRVHLVACVEARQHRHFVDGSLSR